MTLLRTVSLLGKAAVVGVAASVLAIGITGCSDDDDTVSAGAVTGTYECGLEGQPTREVWQLREDQSLLVRVTDASGLPEGAPVPIPAEGTWSIEDGQVIIDFEGADNDPFNVEGDRLVFAGPEGPEGLWVCTRTTREE